MYFRQSKHDALLAAVTLPKFKLSWLRDQERKDLVLASLVAECRKYVPEQDEHPGETPTTQRRPSSQEDEFFCFDESEEDAYVSVEN